MENKLNLPPFYIGQKVVCKKGGRFHKKGEVTKITNQAKSMCGCWYVGTLKSGIEYLTPFTAKCSMCGETTTEGLYGFHSIDFAPLQESPAPLLTFEQIKQTEKEEILILN